MKPSWGTGDFMGQVNHTCNNCPRATLYENEIELIVQACRRCGPSAQASDVLVTIESLAGVNFASDEAAELALRNNVSKAELERVQPTGQGAAYKLVDVQLVISNRSDGNVE